MPFVTEEDISIYEGTWQGESRECVALVKKFCSGVGPTKDWRKGDQVYGGTFVQKGTAIATFVGPIYGSTPGISHAAIYIGQSDLGLEIWDQSLNVPVTRRIFLPESSDLEKDALNYFVIEHGNFVQRWKERIINIFSTR